MTRPEGLTTSLYLLGAKLFVSVCRSKLISKYLAPLAVDTFLLKLGVSGEIDPWYLCQGKTSATLHLKPSTWGNQRGARSHQMAAPRGYSKRRRRRPVMGTATKGAPATRGGVGEVW